jgi:glycosyltransferase involved in cell wall biosynthesis
VTSGRPETSIVIPTHGGRFLSATVASIVKQTVTDWELVIVDDGSTDGTAGVAASLAASDPRIRVVTQTNAGIARARNRGLAAISPHSRYVALVDHDDLWMPNTLEILRAALVSHPSAVAAHGRVTSIDAEDRTIEHPGQDRLPWNRRAVIDGVVQTWPLDRPTVFAVLAYDDCIVGVGSALTRREVVDRVGPFDWRAEPTDDYDFWVRVSRIGEIAYVNETVLAFRQHGRNRSFGPPPPRGHGTGYVRRKLVTAAENTPEQRRIAIEGFRAHERTLLKKRWSALVESWRRREYLSLPRQAIAGMSRAVAYARGYPWRWQR